MKLKAFFHPKIVRFVVFHQFGIKKKKKPNCTRTHTFHSGRYSFSSQFLSWFIFFFSHRFLMIFCSVHRRSPPVLNKTINITFAMLQMDSRQKKAFISTQIHTRNWATNTQTIIIFWIKNEPKANWSSTHGPSKMNNNNETTGYFEQYVRLAT